MLKAVTGVVPLAEYRLLLNFAGGESRVFFGRSGPPRGVYSRSGLGDNFDFQRRPVEFAAEIRNDIHIPTMTRS